MMLSKKIINFFLILSFIFTIDRLSKIYILKYFELNSSEIYLTSFLNLILVWNKGIGFGLLSFEGNVVYNFITFFIFIVILILFVVGVKYDQKNGYFYMIIIGGALGNLYDRIYFSAVPDFIDFHLGDFHWFVFNVADIFITIGIFCLIIAEIFFNKTNNDKI
jgi:signal peptidase II|tara:strand:+ start:752 stop:1240 length:489 start_codon:yes stop_codon:yes gene_type:complete